MISKLKRIANIFLKSSIIIVLVFVLEIETNNVVLNAQNSNLEKQVDLKSLAILDMSTIERLQYEQISSNEEVQEVPTLPENNPVASYSGKMTGYVYNCPKCSGRLACDASVDLTNGNINYYDNTYGEVRIVASSDNLPCGSIVSIHADKVSNEPIMAIVLDRGVYGTKLDLLMPSEHEAKMQIGNTPITYEVLRNGY